MAMACFGSTVVCMVLLARDSPLGVGRGRVAMGKAEQGLASKYYLVD